MRNARIVLPSGARVLCTTYWATVALAVSLALGPAVLAQTCDSGLALDPAIGTPIVAAARQYFDMSVRGDVAGLKANAIPALAANFGSIEQVVVANKQYLAAAQPEMTGPFWLNAKDANAPLERANFYCGIYNSPDRTGFSIPNLPPGSYAITIAKVGGKDPVTLTLVLNEQGGAWKLAGYYLKANTIGGHDGDWYLTRAREYKQKSQAHNAWFYYLTAWDLLAPVDFMSTPELEKLADEMQAARPGDLPESGPAMELGSGGKKWKVASLGAVPMGNELVLRLEYKTPAAGNPAAASEENKAIAKALLAKYPEFREAFTTVLAHAIDDNGHEYGTLIAMKDIK